ncbi:alpha/beta hydrolase fold [Actinokineospora alba]|uniref:Alpha/beta hydrolase fold n=1 Tax=Actinokineospora alba TaxID=504798 RepID=A0A1H0VQW7_9PSEU|nr:alpha/beta hydrolase family protein [Actinokineospora alba]SDI37841.1 alpha/beta hydrolase fold [Actinokineospora alba]SDP80907.1 alpha/beta hydrolase fold [Actinokineospora alba]
MAAAAAVGVVAGTVLLTPTVGASQEPIVWGPCERPELVLRGAECGKLEVPLNHADPAGAKIKLAVSRIKATVPADQYQGVMLINPGGPGGAGLGLAVLGERVPNGAGKAYDWVGLDPRGVGASEPSLSCDSGYFTYNRPYYVPVSRDLEQTWLDRSKGYAKACEAAGGDLLGHLRTVDTVQDMDLLRAALGEEKLNFYGYSYGSYLGQVYSTLFPERVRRMVLDGVVDPRSVWYQLNLNQDVAFDRNIKIYFDWLAKHDDAYHLGTDGRAIEAGYYAELEKLRQTPAGGVIGPDELADVFLRAAYFVYGWTDLASAYSKYRGAGDIAGIKALWDGINSQKPGSDNSYAMYLGVQCTDAPWPTNWDRWRADNWRIYATAPFETWSNAWYNAPCVHWAGKPGKPIEVDGSKAPPVLLISETLDGATSFEGALEVRDRFPNSALIEGVGGTTHSSSLFGNLCVDNQVADYLATGELPRREPGRVSDSKCDPHPQPTPGVRAASDNAGDWTRTVFRPGHP